MKLDSRNNLIPASIVISATILASALIYTTDSKIINQERADSLGASEQRQIRELEKKVLPPEGFVLPVTWSDLGAKLASLGAIDADKFKAIYEKRGAFTEEYKNLLLGQNNGQLKITQDNAGYLLNLFWVLGLANSNPILETGEMTNPSYGGAGNFASTGGWTIAKGDPMDHYSKHTFFNLTPEQQSLVERISRGIYRPCCANSVHFPDCNHGMAMLGLLELMASQGASEEDMWKAALIVNSYWFPDTYVTIGSYMEKSGIEWKDISPQKVLGADYSSAQGYARIVAQVSQSGQQRGEGGCGVGTGETVTPKRQQGGCGI
ncbi:MAG: hypothetical protein AAB719_00960 [Patescibacteria group bacterium]